MQTADQLSAVGDKIQDIGTKAMDAYAETENAVTKVNAYFGETGQQQRTQQMLLNLCIRMVWRKHGQRGRCRSYGKKELG